MSERRSMVGVPPTASARRPRGGATPSTAPSRASARSAKRPKKEPVDEEEKRYSDDEIEEKRDSEEEEEEEDDDDSDAEVDITPVRKGRGPGKRKRGTAKLTDYHLKKKSILARKAQRDAEREKEKEEGGGQQQQKEKEKEKEKVPTRKAPVYSEFTPLQLLLDHILRKIVAKDPEEYFAFPVTKNLAPDYHEIVKEPMDFQTIREKIEDNKYEGMNELKRDCELIVTNAMAYNQQNTVFYLAASRLQTLIKYYFGEQYLRFVFHSLPFANKIPLEKAGLTPLAPLPVSSFVNKRKSALVDDLTSEQLLENVDSKIRGKLASRKPNAKLAFLSEKDGTMVLNVLSEENSREKKVTIGEIVGPLEEGTPGLIQLGEHRLYSQTPVNYLNYGPFASFAPQYDSTWSNMTKDDTDLFLRTYGDRTNFTEAMSMKAFVADSGDFMIKVVDDMLDSLTNGEHSKTMRDTGEKKDDENDRKLREFYEHEVASDSSTLQLIDDVSTVSNLGIDVGFLNGVRSDYAKPTMHKMEIDQDLPHGIVQIQHMNVQQQLNHIGQGIQDLAHLQQTRLQQQPPPALAHVPEPGIVEQKLAETVQQQLVHQVSNLTQPSDMVSAPTLHDAMGMEFDDDLMSEFFVTS